MIRPAGPSGDGNYVVPFVHQSRHEPRPDVSRGADDYRAQPDIPPGSGTNGANLPAEQKNWRHRCQPSDDLKSEHWYRLSRRLREPLDREEQYDGCLRSHEDLPAM